MDQYTVDYADEMSVEGNLVCGFSSELVVGYWMDCLYRQKTGNKKKLYQYNK